MGGICGIGAMMSLFLLLLSGLLCDTNGGKVSAFNSVSSKSTPKSMSILRYLSVSASICDG